MKDMDDLDNLMDNFDMRTFWQKRQLMEIFAIYGIYVSFGTILLIKAVLDSSRAGAIPKGMDITNDAKNVVIR